MDCTTLKRMFDFPYPLSAAGYFHDYAPAPAVYPKRACCEVCLRLYSEESRTCDFINGIEVESEYPQVLFKRPENEHRYGSEKKRSGIFFIYDLPIWNRMLKADFLPRRNLFSFTLTPRLSGLIEYFELLIGESRLPGTADKLDTAALEIIEELLIRERGKEEPCSEKERIRRAASWLGVNFMHDPDFEKLALEHGFSLRSFYRVWKREFGNTPASCAAELRLTQSLYLLENSNLRISDIAMQLGFSDDNYFSTRFKRRYGISPAAFRRSRRER